MYTVCTHTKFGNITTHNSQNTPKNSLFLHHVQITFSVNGRRAVWTQCRNLETYWAFCELVVYKLVCTNPPGGHHHVIVFAINFQNESHSHFFYFSVQRPISLFLISIDLPHHLWNVVSQALVEIFGSNKVLCAQNSVKNSMISITQITQIMGGLVGSSWTAIHGPYMQKKLLHAPLWLVLLVL